LLEGLRFCVQCKLGPIPLTFFNIVGELRKGLSGYFYVGCENPECHAVNRVPVCFSLALKTPAQCQGKDKSHKTAGKTSRTGKSTSKRRVKDNSTQDQTPKVKKTKSSPESEVLVCKCIYIFIIQLV